MTSWIRENRSFLLTQGGVLLGALLMFVFVVSPVRGKKTLTERRLLVEKNLYQAAAFSGVPENSALAAASRQLHSRKEDLKKRVDRLGLKLDARFTSKGKASTLSEHFRFMTARVSDAMSDLAAGRSLREFPKDWGFAALPLDGPESAREALLRLGVAEHAVRAAVQRMKEGDKVESVNIAVGDERGTRREGRRFLRRIPVELRVTARSRSVFEAIYSYQASGQYLCLEQVEIRRAGHAGQDLFEARFVVSGLLLDPKAPLRPKSTEEWE